MSIYKSPFLEPYTGRLSRHSCPRCKQNQSFTLYIDGNTVLKDKYVVLYPDAGCIDKWTKKMKEIKQKVPAKMSVSDLIEKHATTEKLEYGYDLADYIIDNTKKETLEKMVEINPALQDLIDELGLEECE